MSLWKISLTSAVLVSLLWLLAPKHSSLSSEPGVVEISYMSPGGPIASPMDDAVREFERLSRIAHEKDPSKPIYRVISGQNASNDQTADPTRFLVSVAGGMPPDVISFDRYAVSEWAARGAFTPLDGYMKKDLKNHRDDSIHSEDFYKSAWNETVYTDPITHHSAVYGIPYSMDSRAFFYNKDLLKRAGFVDKHGEARPPKTWEELEDMATKITEFDEMGRPKRLGFVPNVGDSWLYLYGWMNGGEFMSADGKTCTLNDPKIVSALEWMTQMYDKQGGAKDVEGFESTFQQGDLDPFILGKVAMKIDGVWSLNTMAQYARNLDWAVSTPPMPAAEVAKGRTTMSWVGGWCYAIPSTSKHKDAAWALIRFLNSRKAIEMMSDSERLTDLSEGRSYVPVQNPNIKVNDWLAKKYVYDDPSTDPKVSAALKVFNQLLTVSRFRPVTMVGQLLWNEHRNATENAIFHKLSAQQALDQGTENVQRQLDIALTPPPGIALQWSWFLIPYAILIVFLVLLVYFWDTRYGFRKMVGTLLTPFGGKKLIHMGGDVDGIYSSFMRSQWKHGWLLASPWFFGFFVFMGGPIAFAVLISFCRYDILNPAHFVGLDNYVWLFTKDPLFLKSLWNTIYMLAGVPLGMGLSLAIALLLNLKIRGVAVWRTFFYVPSIVPAVALCILWIWILNPSSGLMNNVLASVGITGPNWLQDENTSKVSLILMGLWGAGGGMIIWLAGLKGISESYYEAASLDGATTIQKFIHVTIPMLSPYIFFNLIMGIIGTFQIFTPAFIMTQGGPVNSTLFYVLYLFNNAFRYLEMGYAAAMSWVLFIIVFVLTMVNVKLSNRWVHYEGE